MAGVSAWAFGLPFPSVLAVIVGFLDLIPQVGATIAGIILAPVALTVQQHAAIAMAVIQIIYQQIENYVRLPDRLPQGGRSRGSHRCRFSVLIGA